MPPKDPKKETKNDRSKYETTQQTETLRQQTVKEGRILQAKTKLDIERLDPYFRVNNNYMGMFKGDEGKVDNGSSVAFSHPLDRLGGVEYEYCQKCKRDVGFCPHKGAHKQTVKDEFKFPVISSAEIGWRQPIDNPNWGYGVKESFPLFSHQFRAVDKPSVKDKK